MKRTILITILLWGFTFQARSLQGKQPSKGIAQRDETFMLMGYLQATENFPEQNLPVLQIGTASQDDENIRIQAKLALFTALLVTVGFLQVVALIWQGLLFLKTLRAVNRQADIMERQSILAQRPRIVVRNFHFSGLQSNYQESINNGGIEVGSDCSGQFYIANAGGSSAHIQERVCIVWIDLEDGQLAAKRPYEGKAGVKQNQSLLPGQSVIDLFSRGGQLNASTASKLKNKQANLYVLGWIGFTDDLSIYRRMRFCRRYDVEKDRFFPLDDSDYEYAE